MKFVSFISDHPDPLYAADSIIGDIALKLQGRPDVVFVFLTIAHAQQAMKIAERVHEQLEPQALLGSSGEGVIGFDREIERQPGLAILAGQLPDVKLHLFHVGRDEWSRLIQDPGALRQAFAPQEESRATIAFADPFSTPMMQLLEKLNEGIPGLPLIGGMASGSAEPGQSRLILNDGIFTEGLVGLTLAGPLQVETVVSQGCRPIGRPFVITRAHDNVIEQLGGRPGLDVLRDVLQELPDEERQLLENGLFIGRVIDEYKEAFGRGDFLLRNVMRVAESNGAIAITDYVRVGQSVQFHVRDAQTADEDLSDLLLPLRADAPAGGVLFTCNGRGTRMFDDANHDIGASQRILPQTPVAGFFAAGELGPVGGKNFIHGHTASFAMFRPKPGEKA